MRARLALLHCGAQCELREVVLKDKPAHMLSVSSKGTVPVFVLPADNRSAVVPGADDGGITDSYRVIDESIDIMHWAMSENPSRHKQNADEWLVTETMSLNEINALIEQNDTEFKTQLDKYKYSDRHPEHSQDYYLSQAMPFLEKLELILSNSPYLGGSQFRFLDASILPFVRQFSMVDVTQFTALPLPGIQKWLRRGLESDLFVSVMQKHPQWQPDSDEEILLFGRLSK